ncbi:DUF4314 domain-containing protein [Psychrobacillus sp. FSL H8-0487]|uniref:DUF4314 domain-containing protein n=1 Tax=Psychrobacillus sp. FSL H8-0487 TaxID=2921391 RepID=UPI0030FB2486
MEISQNIIEPKTIQLLIKARKELYKPNSRVILTKDMEDPFQPLKRGLKGTVRRVDDTGTVHVRWDNGSGLGATLKESISGVLYEKEITKYKKEDVLARMGDMGYMVHNAIWDDVGDHYDFCNVCEKYVDIKNSQNHICKQCESGLIL